MILEGIQSGGVDHWQGWRNQRNCDQNNFREKLHCAAASPQQLYPLEVQCCVDNCKTQDTPKNVRSSQGWENSTISDSDATAEAKHFQGKRPSNSLLQ